jgi:bla regulator protein BlaR1
MSLFQFNAAAIADHLWQATIFALAAWGITSLLKRAPASWRHLLWSLALAKFLVPTSVFIAISHSFGFDLVAAFAPALLPSGGIEMIVQFTQPMTAALEGASAPAAADWGGSGTDLLLTSLLLIWAVGVVVLLWRWYRGAERLGQALMNGEVVLDGRAAAAFAQARWRWSSIPPIDLAISNEAYGPGVWRIWRPVIVLPEGIVNRLTDAELEVVLMHELAHVRRRDNLFGAAQLLIGALAWFHPLVWLIDRRLLAEREMACDEEVLRRGGDPAHYTSGLLKIVQFGLGWSTPSMAGATGSDLKRRIDNMRNVKRIRLTPWRRVTFGATVLLLGLASIALGVVGRSTVDASGLTALTRVIDGVPGGISGGIAGGVAGGIKGGIAGGVSGNYTQKPPPPPPPPPKIVRRKDSDAPPPPPPPPPPADQDDPDDLVPMSEVTARPQITHKEKAGYTQEAKDEGVEGTVVLSIVFRSDGKVVGTKVIRGLPKGLTEEAIKAAEAIQFKPARKGNKAVSVRANLEFSFSLK